MGNGASAKSAMTTVEPFEPMSSSVSEGHKATEPARARSEKSIDSTTSPNAGGSDATPGGNQARTLSPMPGGLAARRAAQGKLAGGLSVATQNRVDPRRAVLGQLHRNKDKAGRTLRTIQKVDSFAKLYSIGAEVMPSVHPGMEIRHATAIKNGNSCVIKIRTKCNSFMSKQEEKEWRQSAEFMLNLPESSSIARMYGVYEDKEAYYVVMERVGGSDLFELLDAEGMLPLHESKAILRQLLKGVAALHEEGCIHKDLKLENVMVDRKSLQESASGEPVVKLIDFDTAQTWEPDSPKAKTVLGTDQYISSEAYTGKYSPASDIFAVGVIAYKLVTGYFPFNEKMFNDEAGENWVGSPKMKQISDKVSHARINFKIKPFPDNPDAVSFIKAMLAPKDDDRPLAEDALNHPFLADMASPKKPPRESG
eukprot:CAMPEP_0170248666 /NCGR_PEP_ID=MMETSP0116_2-20130129/24129_1 /TAXON_ID=400756 /ORGANISM="Durinskia baltica, Strain CSIRO CS-38" /LENGTH=423 /DNA_ID=CAMNT_0010499561 /DNA_START=12 /DNA_END=1283 /DNA_ORIENTATION=-